MAAMNAKLECIKFLVENLNIDPDINSQTGWTPLQLASRSKPESIAIDCVNYLIAKGADPNKTNDMGISSIHQAVSANNLQCVKSLVKNGATVTYTDKRGLAPLDVAKVWGHTECSKYLENVIWTNRKEEEDRKKKRWILEHKKMLDNEIKKYVDAKKSEKVQEAYKSWIDRKQLPSPRLPSHCEARARPMTCYSEEKIHEFHKRKLSQKIRNSNPVSTTPSQTSPRNSFERVKKIQELRNMLMSREEENVAAKNKQAVEVPKRRESTPKSSSISKDISKQSCVIRAKSPDRNLIIQSYRIAKLNEPKITAPPAKEAQRKRKKRRKPRTAPEEPPTRGSLSPKFLLKVDNYFKEPSTPPSCTPDSGFSDETLSPLPKAAEEVSSFDTVAKLEVESVQSEVEITEKLGDAVVQGELDKGVGLSKTVRFSEDIFYDTDLNRAVTPSYATSSDPLRSCIKVRSIRSG